MPLPLAVPGVLKLKLSDVRAPPQSQLIASNARTRSDMLPYHTRSRCEMHALQDSDHHYAGIPPACCAASAAAIYVHVRFHSPTCSSSSAVTFHLLLISMAACWKNSRPTAAGRVPSAIEQQEVPSAEATNHVPHGHRNSSVCMPKYASMRTGTGVIALPCLFSLLMQIGMAKK